jgi:hypothetical protein
LLFKGTKAQSRWIKSLSSPWELRLFCILHNGFLFTFQLLPALERMPRFCPWQNFVSGQSFPAIEAKKAPLDAMCPFASKSTKIGRNEK